MKQHITQPTLLHWFSIQIKLTGLKNVDRMNYKIKDKLKNSIKLLLARIFKTFSKLKVK